VSRRIALLAGLYACLGGIASLAGWVLDVPRLADWDNDGICILPNATLCASFSGLGLLALAAGRTRVTAGCGAVVLLIGGLTLLQWVSGVSFGIDGLLLFGREWGRVAVATPGRMGPPGSLSWTLIGTALVLTAGPPRPRRLAPPLGVTTVLVSSLSLVGYLYQADDLYALPHVTVIAQQTATFVLAVSVGIVFIHPDREPMRLLLDPGGAGLLARRALPLMLLVPIVVGLLRVKGQDAGLYDTGLGSALVSLVTIGLLAVLMWWVLSAVRAREQELNSARRAAEADARALDEREHRIAGLLGSITDVFMSFDPQWRFTFINDRGVERMGKPREELIGLRLWEVFPDAVGTDAQTQLHRAMRERVAVEYELFYPPWQRWLFDRVFPTPDGGLAMYSIDITGRKRAEETLRVKEAELENITENTSAMLTRCSRDLRYLFVNKAYADFLGLPREQIQGALIETILGPQALAAIRPRLERVLRGETLEYEDELPFDRVGPRWVLARYVPDYDPAGRVQGWYASVQDITRRKLAEVAVRESEALFRTMGEAVPDFLWMADADGRPIYQNPAWRRYVGLTHEELVTKGWEVVHYPEDVPALKRVWADAIARGKAFGVEVRTRRHDGVYRWFAGRTVPLKDDAGRVIRWVGTMTDVHDRKTAEEALTEADRRKNEFLATLAHELRNPLAPVRNAVEVLRIKGSDAPELHWARDVIARQMRQMTRLIDDLMDVSRISQGKIELRRERVAMATVIQGAIETSRPLIEQCGHELTVDVPQEPIYLTADVTRLAQVFANLLNNAAKYTERGGVIRLTAARQGSDVVVSVKDSGIGIPRDKLQSVFELFSQVQGSLERSLGGLGIGLSLAKRLVEMHDGDIEARCEGPGMGSEFVVRLPLNAEPLNAAPRRDGEEPDARASSLRILIVDDNRDGADSLGMMLGLTGNEIRTAYDGEQAVHAAGEFRPQVVLLDIGLPKLNGYEACRRIRQQPWGQSMVLIAVTGWGQEDDKRKAKEAGFDQHLVKPVDPRGLIKLLGALPAGRDNEPDAAEDGAVQNLLCSNV
jgi:PAS domain S-box-containing protein